MKLTATEDGRHVVFMGGAGEHIVRFSASQYSPHAKPVAKDIAHRYNMHDKLVGALKEMVDVFACIRPTGCVHIKVARDALKEAKQGD